MKRASTGSTTEEAPVQLATNPSNKTAPTNTDNAAQKKSVTTIATVQRINSPISKPAPDKASRNTTTNTVEAAVTSGAVNKTDLPQHLQGVKRIFTRGRTDRSGAAILYYLRGHAYARKWGLEYGGVCSDTDTTPVHESMLQTLGLSHEIPLHSCPLEGDSSQVQYGIELMHEIFAHEFSMEWCKYMQNQTRHATHNTTNSIHNDPQRRPLQVAVHVRRGDVSPCSVFFARYLPNQHFRQVIEKYILDPTRERRPVNITFFSETSETLYQPLEDLLAFGGANQTYITANLALDGSIEEVWRQMIESDVLILSKSSFAEVPALLSPRLSRIIHTPYRKYEPGEMDPMDNWEIVDSAIMDQSKAKLKEMRKKFCPEKPGLVY
jgi:hypothetical protein